ncbi:MAG: DUF1080 domain-containing protein [Terrimonas sp.]|nr:DUF1080 domain-containing protein [Terrimonas sp.]
MLAKNALPFAYSVLIGAVVITTACNSGNSQGNNETAANDSASAAVQTADAADFKSIFDGKTLAGWEGDSVHWSVEDGAIVGTVTPETLLKTNTFLVWKGDEPKDFELKAEFKIAATGNSGINYRSEMFPGVPHGMKGYQADIDGKNTYTGQNYEERGRTTLAYRGQKTTIPDAPGQPERNAWSAMVVDGSVGNSDSLKALIKAEDWNQIHIIAKGNHLQHFVNGALMSDVTDNDPAHSKASGLIGVQVHVGPPMTVRYRNIQLKELK